MSKKVIPLLMILTILISSITIGSVTYSASLVNSAEVGADIEAVETSANSYGLVSNIQDGTILHCFDWKYNDIKSELKNIAEAGFTSVQTSPAQACNGGSTWFWLYQPRGFYIGTNGIGTKDELKSLCREADKFGIKIVVDVVANHLEGDHSNIVDELKDQQYWHNFGGNVDWSNRWQVTHGDIGMKDLATENSYVQQIVKRYIDELKSCGVDGIRFDAAKHIGLPSEGDDFWKVVTSDRSLWYYGEILGGPDDRSSGNEGLMKEYTDYMTVTDSTYGKTLRDSFSSRNAPSSNGHWSNKGISQSKLIYWGESHDTWSNNEDWGYSWGIDQNDIDRAYAVAASRKDATALYFSRPSSHYKDNIHAGQKGSTHFSSKEVAAVNHFHNAMVGQNEYFTTGDGCTVICREQGAVIVKGSGSGQVTVPNGGGITACGTYTDEITGKKWTVTTATISGEIGSSGIAVIYNKKQSPSNTISQAGGKFKSDTLSLTIGLANATYGTYQINGGSVEKYTSAKTITIGGSVAYGSNITLKLTATNSGETTSVTYTFQKIDPSAQKVITFSDNVVYLWDTAEWTSQNCYTWKDDCAGETAWPGTKMTFVDTFGGYKLYKFTIANGDNNLIFNANSTQTPDLKIPSGLVVYDNSKKDWVDANTIDEDAVARRDNEIIITNTPIITTAPIQTVPKTTGTPAENQYIYGDVNLDEKISITDATLIQKVVSSLCSISSVQKKIADVDSSGNLSVKDATLIQKYVAGFIIVSPIGKKYTDTTYPAVKPTNPTVKPTTPAVTKPIETQPPTTIAVENDITITLIDSTPQRWLSDANAVFVLEDTSTGQRYNMSGSNGSWQVTIPKSVSNIKFLRNNPDDGYTWNSWTATVSGNTFYATGNEAGNW